ncbi:hypothetical protein ACF06L_15430 [Streptomyces sp. NPDC015408]|uniref:hypothetical protein n=1 Tax=Streptomyces sp. NPDC015408 TaxID=3364956 RepID=UPI0036FDEDB9
MTTDDALVRSGSGNSKNRVARTTVHGTPGARTSSSWARSPKQYPKSTSSLPDCFPAGPASVVRSTPCCLLPPTWFVRHARVTRHPSRL